MLQAAAPAERHRNQSRRGKGFLAPPKKSELRDLSAVGKLRSTALRSCGPEGCGGAGHEDSKPSSSHAGKRGSHGHRFDFPRTTRHSRAGDGVPARHGSRRGASETVFWCAGCVRRNGRLRREASAPYAAVPQEGGGIASRRKEANKSPSQVFCFSLAFTFAMTQTPRTKKTKTKPKPNPNKISLKKLS